MANSLRFWLPGLLAAWLFSGAAAAESEFAFPGSEWTRAEPAVLGMDAARLEEARDYALSGGGSGYITRHGRLALAWGDPRRLYDLKSTTKSFGATALGVAILDGRMRLEDPAAKFHPGFGVPPPENAAGGRLGRITLLHLATHTAGFEKPGGYTPLVFEPGKRWRYSDGGPNWLAECITLVYRRDLEEWMFERVFTPIGIRRDDLRWRPNQYRDREIDGIPRREFGAGIHANVDAMARLGCLYLCRGLWKERRILPESFADAAGRPVEAFRGLPVDEPETYGRASDHYGILWWNNADGSIAKLPRDAFWSWGLFDSLILVVPSLDVVAARAGGSWKRAGGGHHEVLKPFFEPIAEAVLDRPRAAPYPPSPLIRSWTWAPVESIARRARGSDNWPLTWADDGDLYGAYGDGRGFEPFVDRKLSLGLSRIRGGAGDFEGFNLRAESLEQIGDGPSGLKASGLLMARGVLYLWARNAADGTSGRRNAADGTSGRRNAADGTSGRRNAANSLLAWSRDRGRAWTWSEWKWTESFGCPTFLNFGRGYDGARDGFAYVYSHDSAGAYEAADRMVLARVPLDRIVERQAYEFFSGRTPAGEPLWSRELSARAAVFENPGRCYRSSVSFCAGLKRYLWCQTLLPRGEKEDVGDATRGDARFQGGLGIYDAPEPWGPWTTAFYSEAWDVGPGETSSLPAKWMSADGRVLHLVFSGDDCFSVRRAELELSPGQAAE